jgi:Ni/Fe-hydrogenase subunit HybB-like protein
VRFAVIAVLVAFLAGAIFAGHYGWVSAGNVTMPAWGWLMMGLGIFFTLAIGGGLMVLIFYSSRAGYDEAPQIEYDDETEDGSESQSTARSRTVLPMSSRRNSKRRGDKQQQDKATQIRA